MARIDIHHLCTIQGYKPVRWAYELHAVPTIGKLIGHYLWNRQIIFDLRKSLLDSMRKGLGARLIYIKQRIGLTITLLRYAHVPNNLSSRQKVVQTKCLEFLH